MWPFCHQVHTTMVGIQAVQEIFTGEDFDIIPTCNVNFIFGSMFNYFTIHIQKDIEIFRRQLPCDILYSVLNKIKIRDMQMQESEEEIPVSSDSSES